MSFFPHINCECMIYNKDHWRGHICFTHGRLYATASRVCSTSKLNIFVPNTQTRNVVY